MSTLDTRQLNSGAWCGRLDPLAVLRAEQVVGMVLKSQLVEYCMIYLAG